MRVSLVFGPILRALLGDRGRRSPGGASLPVYGLVFIRIFPFLYAFHCKAHPRSARRHSPVVYGVWGCWPLFRSWRMCWRLSPNAGSVSSVFGSPSADRFSIIAGGIVLAVMIAPLIISVVYEILQTVPDELRHASLAVGATQWQTIRQVVIPRVIPGWWPRWYWPPHAPWARPWRC